MVSSGGTVSCFKMCHSLINSKSPKWMYTLIFWHARVRLCKLEYNVVICHLGSQPEHNMRWYVFWKFESCTLLQAVTSWCKKFTNQKKKRTWAKLEHLHKNLSLIGIRNLLIYISLNKPSLVNIETGRYHLYTRHFA